MYTIWNAPSDRDYYGQLPYPEDEEEPEKPAEEPATDTQQEAA